MFIPASAKISNMLLKSNKLFQGVGGILAVLQLMIIVLACCLATNYTQVFS